MFECTFAINVCRGFIGLLGALCVVSGVIKVDSDYDNHGKTSSPIGNALFFIGWVLFASSIGLINNNLTGLNFGLKSLFGFIGSFLVMAAASLSQQVMYKKNVIMMRLHLFFFIAAWGVAAYAISIPFSATDTHQYIKFGIAFVGAIGVILGMILQMQYRKRGFDFIKTGTVSQGNSYSPGLPVFTAGWLFLAFANALL